MQLVWLESQHEIQEVNNLMIENSIKISITFEYLKIKKLNFQRPAWILDGW